MTSLSSKGMKAGWILAVFLFGGVVGRAVTPPAAEVAALDEPEGALPPRVTPASST